MVQLSRGQISDAMLALMSTLSPPNKLSSAKFLVCLNFQCASMLLKVGENIVCVSNSLDPGETPSNSASNPDPSLFVYGTIVVSREIRVNMYVSPPQVWV